MRKLAAIFLLIASSVLANSLYPFRVNDRVFCQYAGPSGGGGGVPAWNDPYSNSLAMNYRFDPTFTNGSGEIIDYSANQFVGYTNVSTINAVIGTNSNGRVEHAMHYSTRTDGPVWWYNKASDVFNGCTAVTFSIWVYPTNMSAGTYWSLMTYNRVDGYLSFYDGYGEGTGLRARFFTDCYSTTSNQFFKSNMWQHVVATWCKDVDSGVPKIYWNATNVAALRDSSGRTSALGAVGTNFWFNHDPYYGASPDYVLGYVDDIKVYTNFYMPAFAVTNLYNNTLKPNGNYETW